MGHIAKNGSTGQNQKDNMYCTRRLRGGESKLWSAAKMISASLSFIGCTLPIGSNGQQEESCRDQKIEEG